MGTKAEKKALVAYPILFAERNGYDDGRKDMRVAYELGYEQAEKDLGWHSVDESLPPIDEEVIVLTNNIHGKTVKGANWICFGHLVDKRYCVDYDGWNFPGVHHWMRCPKIPNEK